VKRPEHWRKNGGRKKENSVFSFFFCPYFSLGYNTGRKMRAEKGNGVFSYFSPGYNTGGKMRAEKRE